MIHYHDFQNNFFPYVELGRGNAFPELNCCPMCGAQNRLQRHGFYERNAIEGLQVSRIPICRLRCPDCRKTLSIFPAWLLPYFQHTMTAILQMLLACGQTRRCGGTRQLHRFYTKRFNGKQTEIALFFRQTGDRQRRNDVPEAGRDLLKRLAAVGPVWFVRHWWRHRLASFMAAAGYRGTRVAPAF